MEHQQHIACDPNVLAGKPFVKGTRLAVDFLLDLFAQGWTKDEVLVNYPHLTEEQLQAVFAYSAARLRDEDTFSLREAG